MEKTEVCFIRLYPDNPEDALIIAGLSARKRKGEKSRVIKDILYAYFNTDSANPPEQKSVTKPAAENPSLSDREKESLKRNLDELSDMLM